MRLMWNASDQPVILPDVGFLMGLHVECLATQKNLEQAYHHAKAQQATIKPLLEQLKQQKYNTLQQQSAARTAEKTVAQTLANCNQQLAGILQQIQLTEMRLAQNQEAIAQTQDPTLQATLRRQRASYTLTLEDLQRDQQQCIEKAQQARAQQQKHKEALNTCQQQLETIDAKMAPLHAACPALHMLVQRFYNYIGSAHCQYLLQKQPQQWYAHMNTALEYAEDYFKELYSGFYPSLLISTQRGASLNVIAHAIILALLLNQTERALRWREWLRQAYDAFWVRPEWSIVLQAWIFALHAANMQRTLWETLDYHRYTPQWMGSFCRSVIALFEHKRHIFTHEMHQWMHEERSCQMQQSPSLALINISALYLMRLAQQRGWILREHAFPAPSSLIQL